MERRPRDVLAVVPMTGWRIVELAIEQDLNGVRRRIPPCLQSPSAKV